MKFTLTDLSVDEVNLIASALAELPLKVSGMLFAKVRDQAKEQEQAPKLHAVPDGEAA